MRSGSLHFAMELPSDEEIDAMWQDADVNLELNELAKKMRHEIVCLSEILDEQRQLYLDLLMEAERLDVELDKYKRLDDGSSAAAMKLAM